MPITEKQADTIKESIDKLTSAVETLNLRLSGLSEKLGTLAGAIKSTTGSKKT